MEQVQRSDESAPPALKRFRFLSSRLAECSQMAGTTDTVSSELAKYIIDLRNFNARQAKCSLDYWLANKASFPRLACLAEDLTAAPASQAFVERAFSVCGMLTSGQRNRMEKSLETRAFLKMNRKLIESVE